MLSGALHYKQQVELFLAQVEAALECYPNGRAIYVPHSGKLTLPEYFYDGRQYGMDPNHVVEYVYNIASYQFQSEFAVKSGDTIDGVGAGGRIQPISSGTRNTKTR